MILIRLYRLFNFFNGSSWQSDRHITSRTALRKVAKTIGVEHYNYCFSHSGLVTAFTIAPAADKIAVDIEPAKRKLPALLKKKIRNIYPALDISELNLVMIFECLIKLGLLQQKPASFIFSSRFPRVEILDKNVSLFAVRLGEVTAYSKVYHFNNLVICITRTKNNFPAFLSSHAEPQYSST